MAFSLRFLGASVFRPGVLGAAWIRPAAGALLALLVVVLGNQVGSAQRVAERTAIDAALLSDDLPIDAYLDRDFTRWLAAQQPS